MEAFSNAASMMVVLFVVVALGYAARKAGLMDDAFDGALSKLVIWVTCPALILDSVLGNAQLPSSDVVVQVLLVSFGLFIPVTAIALAFTRLAPMPEGQRGGHAFTITFSNVGFVGFAVSNAILGSQSLLYLSIYNLAATLLIWTLGAWMISRSGTVRLTRAEQLAYMRKNLLTPTMAACVLALVLALARVTDSGIIGYTCSLLGDMTPPATMLIIGSTMAKYDVKTMLGNPWSYATSLVRLIVVPAVVYLVGGLFVADAYVLAAITLVSAMPAALVGTMMSIIYGGDLVSLSQDMFLTTALSLVTIPLVTMFIV